MHEPPSPSMSVEVAHAHRDRYGGYPVSYTFDTNDMNESSEMALGSRIDVEPAYSAAFDANDSVKRHAACDECRMCHATTCSTMPLNVIQGSAS